MAKYYAVGGVIDVIGSRTWDGFGIYDEKISNKHLNRALYNNLIHKNKDYFKQPKNVDLVTVFDSLDDAILFSETFKDRDYIEAIVKRAPIFEVEFNDKLDFKTMSFKDMESLEENCQEKLPLIEYEKFHNEKIFPILFGKRDAQLKCCILENDALINFKKQAKIITSYLAGYHNQDNNKLHTRTLIIKSKREFFDAETALVFGLTFWTVIIPVVYSLYRVISKSTAKKNLSTGKDYHDVSPLWTEHDKDRLTRLGYSFEENHKPNAKKDTKKASSLISDTKSTPEAQPKTGSFIFDDYHRSLLNSSGSAPSSEKEKTEDQSARDTARDGSMWRRKFN